MKKSLLCAAVLVIAIFQGGCAEEGKNTQAGNVAIVETKAVATETVPVSAQAGEEDETSDDGVKIPCVMVDGRLYADTGYVSSMVRCGTTDGIIDSMVEASKLPEQDNQSNFGTGYEYQYSSQGQIIVVIDGEDVIFRDLAYEGRDIPKEVAHFRAEVKEIRDNGTLLVTFVSAPEEFAAISKGEYVVSVDNLVGEIKEGDIVTIWYNGMILETAPAQIGVVYRIEGGAEAPE